MGSIRPYTPAFPWEICEAAISDPKQGNVSELLSILYNGPCEPYVFIGPDEFASTLERFHMSSRRPC